MAIKLEKLVKTYYEALEEGKLLGRKCPVCGNVEWPPVYACNACGSMETEWYEMSGKGEIVQLYIPTAMSLKPAYKHLEPYAYAWIKTAEGPERNVMVRGITRQNAAYVRAHIPYPVHMDIVQMNGYKTCVFAIDPIDAEGNPVKAAAENSTVAAVVSKTFEALKKLFAQTYGVDEASLKDDTLLDDMKGPSVKFVGLVARLEDEFDAILSVTEAAAAKTIGGLARLIDGESADAPAPAAAAAAVKDTAAASGEETETFKELRKMFAKTYKIDEASITP
ncbi:MAG: hypothetical protein IJJ22_04705, partial [Oscillospiraceae bacterium]|nr:hypothetical protein [Oscillospiraceae bacterium]